MIQDESVNFEDTWSFLHRRFEDTKTATLARNQVTDVINDAIELSSAGLTTVSTMIDSSNVILFVCVDS